MGQDGPPASQQAPTDSKQPQNPAGPDSKQPDTVQGVSQATPDTRPLSGAQYLTLGVTSPVHSVLLPSFSVTTQVGTSRDGGTSTGGSDLQSTTYLSGRLGYNRNSGRSQFLVDYLAGGSFSTDSSSGSSPIQSLNISDTFGRGRWNFLFGDQMSYTSESPFGFGGLGGLNNLGTTLGSNETGGVGTTPGFKPGFVPDQSIFAHGARVSNTAIGQVDYLLSHRSSLTFVGSYGVLRFVDGGFQNSDSIIVQAGYNYALSRKDSIAILYHFGSFRFSNSTPGVYTHSAQFSFARRMTGRMSFQAGAGPEIRTFESVVTGSGTSVSWTASTSLSYQLRHGLVSFGFDHSATGGSGIFPGASTNVVQAQGSHTFSRNWSGGFSAGYSRNETFQQTTGLTNALNLNSWFANARVSRHLTPGGVIFASYSASRQSGGGSVCAAAICGTNSTSHVGSIGYSWGYRPIVVE